MPSLMHKPMQRWELALPNRSDADLPGKKLFESLKKVSAPVFQKRLKEEIAKGNIPSFLRQLVPVGIRSGKDILTIWTMSDYLSVGDDHDFVRVALDLPTAKLVARELDLLLPTRKMVNAIYNKAGVKLEPRHMEPGPRMTSIEYMLDHHKMIEKDLSSLTTPRLIAGHKKDLVMSPRLYKKSKDRVAIYGWHQKNGKPIQPLSLWHHEGYYDYSHGVRFVARYGILNGRIVDLTDILQDPRYIRLVSDEGVFPKSPELSLTRGHHLPWGSISSSL
ncbi:MAG: hypothetical protein AB8C84_07585 [Oligoflexales bacterium]